MIEFAAVYYALNRALAQAAEARLAGDLGAERAALEQLQAASRIRDVLEDRCAPAGFYAEPLMAGERYADLYFMWAGKPPRDFFHVHSFEAEFFF